MADNTDLTEEQKLVKLGLRSPNQTQSSGLEIIQILQENIAEDWSDFQTDFGDANLSSWGDFETWLSDNGVGGDTATNVRNQLEAKYTSWSSFSDGILNEYTSWSDFENAFSPSQGLRSNRTNEGGLSAAGIRFYEEAGVGRSGQQIPAGGVEIFGTQIHFSRTGAVRDTPEESAGSSAPWTWDNLTLTQNTAQVGEEVTASADVTNNAQYGRVNEALLIFDAEVHETKRVAAGAGQTVDVKFTFLAGDVGGVGEHEVSISHLGPEELTVIYGGL